MGEFFEKIRLTDELWHNRKVCDKSVKDKYSEWHGSEFFGIFQDLQKKKFHSIFMTKKFHSIFMTK
jgi:hypothetical protein